jgi:uncharacterized protein (TIGR03435 family)
MSKTILIIVALLVGALVALFGLMLVFFPFTKDAYFAMNQGSLAKVPAGIVMIRPTHFPTSVYRRGVMHVSNNGTVRIMGRNATLSELMATAYGQPVALVVLPPNAPTNNYDFLVTVKEPQKRLQDVVRKKLGYIAKMESHDADALALKVENANLPGLTVSSPDEKEGANPKDGRLYITHMRLKELSGGFEQILKVPVIDETGLTNAYDFSLPWNSRLMMSLRNADTARPSIEKILTDWGLGFEPTTTSMDMLVVKKAD